MKPTTRPVYAQVGDGDEIYTGVAQIGVRWNGFLIVGFTRAQVEPLVKNIEEYVTRDQYASASSRLFWLPNGHLIEWRDSGDGPYVEDCGPDEDGLFWPGAFGWTWVEADADSLEKAGIDPGGRNLPDPFWKISHGLMTITAEGITFRRDT